MKLRPVKDPKDTNTITFNDCPKVMRRDVYYAKQHLVGGYRNVGGYKKVSEPIYKRD